MPRLEAFGQKLRPSRRVKLRPPGFSIPHRIRPSAIPVHIVCGAPGSGKSTFIREHAAAGDLIVDFDNIRQSIGATRYDDNPHTLRQVFRIRDEMLRSLCRRNEGEAWLAIMAPTDGERRAWCRALGRATIHSIDTPPDECKRRIDMDPTREGARPALHRAVDDYFKRRG